MRINEVLDANEVNFFNRELEQIKARVYETKYPGLNARRMFPVSSEGGVGVQSITYQMWKEAGSMAELVRAYGNKVSRVEVEGGEVTVPVQRFAKGFGMTIDEVQASARTGRPLSARKAMAARRANERRLNSVAFDGMAAANLQGLFSHANIPWGYATTGSWTNGTTTAAQILADIRVALAAVRSATNGVETITEMAMPASYFEYLSTMPLHDHSDTTILEFIMSKIPNFSGRPDSVFGVNELESVATLAGDSVDSGTGRPVVTYYSKSPDLLELEIPEDINFMPPQTNGLEVETLCTMKTGGLNVYAPLSIFNQCMITDPS